MSPDEHLIASPRLNWYNPKLDPYVMAHKMTDAMREAVTSGRYDDGTERQSGPLNEPDAGHPANLVSSLCEDGMHRPALDIDIPFGTVDLSSLLLLGALVVVPSSSGNTHVYAPSAAMTWSDYLALLGSLVDERLVEDRYVAHSFNRGQTLLRLPGVPKYVTTSPPDA